MTRKARRRRAARQRHMQKALRRLNREIAREPRSYPLPRIVIEGPRATSERSAFTDFIHGAADVFVGLTSLIFPLGVLVRLSDSSPVPPLHLPGGSGFVGDRNRLIEDRERTTQDFAKIAPPPAPKG